MNLRNLSDETLHKNTLTLAHCERQTTLEILHHLREVERRSLYAARAYSSLFEYVVGELKYSAGAAHRRIASMRLLKELPELEKKVEAGVLNLSSLAQAQTFFRHEKSSVAEKREVIRELENKSTREVERELATRSSDPSTLYQEKLRPVSAEHSELKILIDDELLRDLEALRGLLAHKKPGASIKDLLAYALRHTVAELKPRAPKSINTVKGNFLKASGGSVSKSEEMVPALEVKATTPEIIEKKASRYIPAEIRRQVWSRDEGRCGYIDAVTGCCCGSRHALEFDHIQAFALGGASTVENLRLRCRTHNQLAAVNNFGVKKMSEHINRLR